jgi:plastocyanin
MRLRKRYLPLVVLLGAAVAVLPGLASGSAPSTASFTASDFEWKVSGSSEKTVTIAVGGTVTFSYPSGASKHNADFGTGAQPSSCTQTAGTNSGTVPPLPNLPTSPSWSGSCTFNAAGTYMFHCDLHQSMTGTITVVNPGEPTATTELAGSVTETSATLKGMVNPNGEATEYFFEYGTSTSYGHNIPEPPKSLQAGNISQSVSETVTGLASGTLYHFRLVAKNTSGIAHGTDQTFTTASPPPPPGPPTATTGEATGVSETEATLKGTVNPDGEATKYVFRWGTTESYGQETSVQPAGSDHLSHPVSAVLKGLAPGTTYHFRLVAENNSGTVPGGDQVFTTTSPLPPTTTTSTTTATPPPTTTTTPPTPLVEPPPGPPITGGSSLHSTQRGTSVKGSLDVSQTGAGGRLEVDLTAKSASLARGRHSKQVTVGRLVRPSVSAGTVSFFVPLSARGKSALRRHHRLALTVRITLTPTRGAAVTVVRGVVLRA